MDKSAGSSYSGIKSPAEVRIKRHRDDEVAKTFFFMDQNSWEQIKHSTHLLRKTYTDPVQLQVRILVERSIIMAFALFKYVQDPDEKNFVPKLDGPHDACIVQILGIVNAQRELCVAEIQAAITDGTYTQDFLDQFKETISCITSGFIAKQVLGMLSTMEVGKNWNSHGALLGASICQTAAMLAGLDTATTELISPDFVVLIPQGCMQTGQEHGHHDVSYMEFMASQDEVSLATVATGNYLEHGKFKTDGHAEKVMHVMDRSLPGTSVPVPRPTRSRTFDFNLTYRGARLLDGECKGQADKADAAILVLHSLDQLAMKDSALALLTTNFGFTYYRSTLVNDESKTVRTVYQESERIDLGPVAELVTDSGTGQDVLGFPPVIDVHRDCWREHNVSVMNTWRAMRTTFHLFISVILDAIDIITDDICQMDIEEIKDRRQNAFDNKGWREPSYSAVAKADSTAKRDIIQQEMYKYCKATMDPLGAQADAIATGSVQ